LQETSVDFRILGPLEVEVDGRVLPLGGAKQRALLALLLLHANQVVPRDRLIDDLWGDRAPETAATALQGYVSALRKTLGAERIVTRAPGYLLAVDPGSVDLGRFERLVREGRAAFAADDADDASRTLSEALALWRGPPLADLNSMSFAYAEGLRLEQLRLAALEERIEAELALGRHADVVPDLEALVAQHPLREKLRGQLMVALYRCGRQPEALRVYQEARRLLVGELGLEPGPALRRLEQAILNQDPALEAPPAATAPSTGARPRRRRRALAVLGVVVFAACAAAAAAAVLLSRSDHVPAVVANSLVKIDRRTNQVVDVVGVGRFPGKVVAGYGFVWVVNIRDETLTRVGVRAGRPDLVGGLRVKQPAGLTDGGRGVFVGSFADSEVVRIDPSTLQVQDRLRLPGKTALFLAAGAGSLWVTQPPVGFHEAVPSAISRVSLLNGRIERRFSAPVGVLPGQIAFGEGAAWVANVGDGTVWRIDAATNRIKRVQVGSQPTDVAVGFGSVWVPCLGRNAVWRLDAASGTVEAIIPAGEEALALVAGAGAVWVTNQAAGTVSRIDPRTNKVVKTIRLGFNPHGIAVADGAVWVAVAQGRI
jgi:YVTN family beta-propeller protein